MNNLNLTKAQLFSFSSFSKRKMSPLICLLMSCCWSMVYSMGRCPFPGITANAEFADKSISWRNGRSFVEEDLVEYSCPGSWRRLPDSSYSLVCRSDGTWSKPLPRCGLYHSKDAGNLRAQYGLNPARNWVDIKSCNSSQISSVYSVKMSREVGAIDEFVVDFCTADERQSFYNTTLDGVKECSRKEIGRYLIRYSCDTFPLAPSQPITIHMKDNIPLDNIFVYSNPGNNCGWPPVPVHGNVISEVEPGKTVQVHYECNRPFVLEGNGPRSSTCSQMTGLWTQHPRCICADPDLPANVEVAEREAFSVRLRCRDGFDMIGSDVANCDDTGIWGELPSCRVSFVTVAASLALILIIVHAALWVFRKRIFKSTSGQPPTGPRRDQSPTTTESSLLDENAQYEEVNLKPATARELLMDQPSSVTRKHGTFNQTETCNKYETPRTLSEVKQKIELGIAQSQSVRYVAMARPWESNERSEPIYGICDPGSHSFGNVLSAEESIYDEA